MDMMLRAELIYRERERERVMRVMSMRVCVCEGV